MPRRTTGVLLAALAALATGWLGLPPATAVDRDVVATGVSRPLQLALDGRTLIILGPGQAGDSAGELYRVDLDGAQPADLSRLPRLRLPFPDARTATFGSLAVDPVSRDLFLGEENGTRIYRLGPDGRLVSFAVGLHRLAGGTTLAFDGHRRLLVVDHLDPTLPGGEERALPELESIRDDPGGPRIFRLVLDHDAVLPRRLDRLIPIFPRGAARQSAESLAWFISVASLPGGDVALLASSGVVVRLGANGRLTAVARLPAGHGQYNRTSMVTAPDGAIFVSGGFHVARVFRVRADGAVDTIAENLGDPEGLAVDGNGYLYIAESAFHRVIRVKVS
jgi:hypothetical protein